MKVRKTATALLGVVIAVGGSFVQARVADEWQLSFSAHVEGGGLVIPPGSVVQWNALDSSSAIDVVAANTASLVTAFERIDNERYYYSLATHEEIDGLVVSPSDVVRYDNGVVSLALDGSAAGLPDGVSIDALSLADNGDLLLSMDRHAQLGGSVYAPGDIIGFDGNVFYSHLSAQAIGLADGVNLVGLTQVVGDQLAVTLERTIELADLVVHPGDVVLLGGDGSMRSRVYRAALSFPDQTGLSALSAMPAPQALFSDRFEQP